MIKHLLMVASPLCLACGRSNEWCYCVCEGGANGIERG